MAECHGDIKHPAKDQKECQLGRCDVCTCETSYDPVCCNGIDYDNQCVAACSIDMSDTSRNWCIDETCAERGHCTLEYEPVCCTIGRDEITYSNQCLADLDDAEVCRSGTCESTECECTREWDPYCCQTQIGRVQFDNTCIAKCNGIDDAVAQCEPGLCDRQPCGCTLEYGPLCCDDITYYNPCNAECYGIPHPAQDQANCKPGTC